MKMTSEDKDICTTEFTFKRKHCQTKAIYTERNISKLKYKCLEVKDYCIYL